MSMKAYEKLKDMLCEELESITKKGELTAGSLETVDKLTHSIKSLETIMAMHGYDNGGSQTYSYDNGNSMRGSGGSSYAGYDDEMSNARGRGRNARRDSMGRYSSRGYSYDGAKDEMIENIRDLMEDAPDEKTKREFQRFLNKLENM